MDREQFYETPCNVANQLIDMIKYFRDGVILEPSAGKGKLIEAFKRRYESSYRRMDIHTIEINEERREILKGAGYKVVWDDFLTFNPLIPYSVIFMNPPFHNGVEHLMKAIQICSADGEVVCILNAETIKNPYSKERKALLSELEKQAEYKVKYIELGFKEAKRITSVEVALIYVHKKKTEIKCITFEKFHKTITDERNEIVNENEITRYGEVEQLLDRYKSEVLSALSLYDEIKNYSKITFSDDKDIYRYKQVFEIKVNDIENTRNSGSRADIVRTINYNYWKRILYSKELEHLFTTEMQKEYAKRLNDMADYEFNLRNILQLKEELCKNIYQNIEVAIMKVWETFTSKYAYQDYSNNILYYNGWKTNKAYKVNKKVIIPMYAFDSWDGKFESYRVAGELSDIEKVFSYLDCGETKDFEMAIQLKAAQKLGQSRNIDTKYFKVTLYKKGTCHLVFKDMELLKKFNLYIGRKKKWLPDGYGRKSYSSMSIEEQEIVESFEGKESYESRYIQEQVKTNQPTNLLAEYIGK